MLNFRRFSVRSRINYSNEKSHSEIFKQKQLEFLSKRD